MAGHQRRILCAGVVRRRFDSGLPAPISIKERRKMTFTDVIIQMRGGRELTPFQKRCLADIEKPPKKYQLVEQDGTIKIYRKSEN